jgi:tRNA pseudouridine55 synthase
MISHNPESDRVFHFETGEILSIDKPSGITSFEVVRCVRRWTRCQKVGHAGTLDPLATGVILICTGRATKTVRSLQDLDKEYEGTMELGSLSETDDSEGPVRMQCPVPDFSREDIEAVFQRFEGDLMQIPPMYSALKKDGRRLYKIARDGQTVEREPRPVKIHDLTVLEWSKPLVRFRVVCSKGTYVRVLARDIGLALGTGGFLRNLRRMRIGPYRIEESVSLETFRLWMGLGHGHLSVD